jgi:hypothetical protein
MNLKNIQIDASCEFQKLSKQMEAIRIALPAKPDRDIYEQIFLPLYRLTWPGIRQPVINKNRTYGSFS